MLWLFAVMLGELEIIQPAVLSDNCNALLSKYSLNKSDLEVTERHLRNFVLPLHISFQNENALQNFLQDFSSV